jgi:predicted ATPase
MREALALAQALSHPFSLGLVLIVAAYIHQFRCEGQAAQARAEATVTLSTEHGFPFWLAAGTIVRGWALAMQGQEDEGISQMQQGLAAFRATGSQFLRPYYLALLAEGYGRVGQTEEGLGLLAEALATAHHTGEHFWEAELHRLQGELSLALSADHHAEAEARFQQALAVARRQQAKSCGNNGRRSKRLSAAVPGSLATT